MGIHRNQRKLGSGIVGVLVLTAGTALGAPPVELYQSDFNDGTLQITESGRYRLMEDISFNPHPVGSPAEDGVTPLDAYAAGRPFFSQFGDVEDGKYDPAAYGIGFFAAIAVSADNVRIDLNGFTLEQSAEHALHQRFFALIETADQPFIPTQGPSGFGDELVAANHLVIKNGTLGRSAHHGIHGNDNEHVTVRNVDFVDFEVAAIALNGVRHLTVRYSTAHNRLDVPIIGTFSNARFISAYMDFLADSGSPITLSVQGTSLSAAAVRAELRAAINHVFEDVIADGLGFIDESRHPTEYALFHNKFGVVDGNAYGYLVNPLGVAVGGFPSQPVSPSEPASDITFRDVHILSQQAFINEVVALNQGGAQVKDPVGGVFMVRNVHPDSGAPVTTSSLDEETAVYTGNALANAQALVAKAALAGQFPPFLDVSRLTINQAVLTWIESGATLDSLVSAPSDYLCNGDTMFHVNKGVIGFKMDGAERVKLIRTSAANLINLGAIGSADCGNYIFSHPSATLPGYGGARARGYSFAGSKDVTVKDSEVTSLFAANGSAIGFDVLTDSEGLKFKRCSVNGIDAGASFSPNGGPNELPDAVGFYFGSDATAVTLSQEQVSNLTAFDQTVLVRDESM